MIDRRALLAAARALAACEKNAAAAPAAAAAPLKSMAPFPVGTSAMTGQFEDRAWVDLCLAADALAAVR